MGRSTRIPGLAGADALGPIKTGGSLHEPWGGSDGRALPTSSTDNWSGLIGRPAPEGDPARVAFKLAVLSDRPS